MPLMGVREYGRHRGVSHVAVLKAIRSGRIRQNPDGLIDSDRADRDWARNTHPAPRAPRAVQVAGSDGGYSRARAVREHFLALLARLEFEERAARLVNADDVKVAAFRAEQAFREHMMRVPAAVASQVAAETDEHHVHVVLDAAIRRALLEFADGPGRGGL